eukprot:GHUV01012854.1.p1 GENE.GHUV01012854.1~~GHUV01012854.1.p1  ORF type:complete len:373 (+),score=106.15 GHUV01012854.1:133-1251(+)
MCARVIASSWTFATGLSRLLACSKLTLLWGSSRCAHSEVDAMNKELAEFFGVEHTIESQNSIPLASSEVASAQHIGFETLAGHISSASAPTPGRVHGNHMQHLSTQAAEPSIVQKAEHSSQQAVPTIQQLCTMQLQEQVLATSRLLQQVTAELQERRMHVEYVPQWQSQGPVPQSPGHADCRQPGDNDSPSGRCSTSDTVTAGDGSVGQQLTHVDSSGKASMVDVSNKNNSSRTAVASCIVRLGPAAYQLVKSNQIKKGDVLTLAQIAGIQGAKQTANLIPLCHNIFLSKVDVHLQLQGGESAVVITATAKTLGQTGVEMEALTAASVAALTVYDMCKAVSKDIIISDIRLDYKSGGTSGTWSRGQDNSSSV